VLTLKELIWFTGVPLETLGAAANPTPFSPSTRLGDWPYVTDVGLNGRLYCVPSTPPTTSTAWYGDCGTGGLDGEIVHVASTPPLPSGMMLPGNNASFCVVELSSVLELELSELIWNRYSMSEVITPLVMFRTSYST